MESVTVLLAPGGSLDRQHVAVYGLSAASTRLSPDDVRVVRRHLARSTGAISFFCLTTQTVLISEGHALLALVHRRVKRLLPLPQPGGYVT
jgi:hypothetical protein